MYSQNEGTEYCGILQVLVVMKDYVRVIVMATLQEPYAWRINDV